MGRSPAGEESPYIVYHFPEQQSRISFIDLWFRCIDQDVNILLGMVDQLVRLSSIHFIAPMAYVRRHFSLVCLTWVASLANIYHGANFR